MFKEIHKKQTPDIYRRKHGIKVCSTTTVFWTSLMIIHP